MRWKREIRRQKEPSISVCLQTLLVVLSLYIMAEIEPSLIDSVPLHRRPCMNETYSSRAYVLAFRPTHRGTAQQANANSPSTKIPPFPPLLRHAEEHMHHPNPRRQQAGRPVLHGKKETKREPRRLWNALTSECRPFCAGSFCGTQVTVSSQTAVDGHENYG